MNRKWFESARGVILKFVLKREKLIRKELMTRFKVATFSAVMMYVNIAFGQISYQDKKWNLQNVELKNYDLIGQAVGDSRIVMLGEQVEIPSKLTTSFRGKVTT